MRFLLPILLLALAWGHAGSVVAADDAEAPIAMPLSLDIVDEAGIDLVSRSIARITAPADALIDLGRGDTTAVLNGLYDGSIEVSDPAAINGFYGRSLGRINGIAPVGTRLFLVTDEPSVHDERVSSHEIGHILGLHHETSDSDRLMFSGTNGIDLAGEEVATARYVAQGIIDGLR